MNVLVTGSAGFIGARVSGLLLEQGHRVTGLDNLTDFLYPSLLKRHRLEALQAAPAFDFAEIDVTDRAAVAALMEQPFDAVINLAARAGVRASLDDPFSYFETNVLGTLNLLEGARRGGISRFVLASSSSVYGNSPVPFHEGSEGDPMSPYGASKRSAESLAATYSQVYEMDIASLRYFTVYGPAGRPDMSVLRFVKKISEGEPITVFGDGNQTRDFTYIDDIARGTIAALAITGHEAINLGNDAPSSVNDLIHHIESLTGNEAEVRHEERHPADPLDTRADITKARRLLDWAPSTPFEDGVAAAVDWYSENRDWVAEVID